MAGVLPDRNRGPEIQVHAGAVDAHADAHPLDKCEGDLPWANGITPFHHRDLGSGKRDAGQASS
jgi:hypothetical protein